MRTRFSPSGDPRTPSMPSGTGERSGTPVGLRASCRLARLRGPWPQGCDLLHFVPPGARPQGRRGVNRQCQRVRGSLVVDPPAQEICPRVLEGALDRIVDSAQAIDGLDKIVV